MVVACQQGTLTVSDTWFHPPILGIACVPIVETRFLELAMSYSTFRLEYPLVLSRFCFRILENQFFILENEFPILENNILFNIRK